ncbi:MAG: DNA methyltransferase [Candidatus Omnitrophica bacterium]|nr:DNA methyltransferase [Candidatus Omnitrophota bacterium]MDD5653762.1 DNA methyltransferase [Candidatus Omnitrophota bacterium]
MINIDILKADKNWSLQKVKRRETLYATHGYHKYPAKFIPQLVRKVIIKYSKPGEIVLDSFGGCGTTLVESKLNGRKSIGVDVNKVAVLISKVKTIGISPALLEKRNEALFSRIDKKTVTRDFYHHANERLKYWFDPLQYNKLKLIYDCIQEEPNKKINLFYKCCFSNILKNCSIWLAKSIKPQRDFEKKEEEPVGAFKKHLNYMSKKNKEFVGLVTSRKVKDISCKMLKGDARKVNLPAEHVDLIVTSPPYVTSYEYAELHQLSILWFNYTDDIKKIKTKFVGTESKKIIREGMESGVAKNLVGILKEKNKKLARHVSNYYFDLTKCYKEMFRVLKKDKHLCIIIGDTEYDGIKIPNAEISVQLLENIGFEVKRVVKRKLSSKIFTPYRDKDGRFTDSKHGNKRKIYQYEYLIFARKPKGKGGEKNAKS